ncbi:MAG: cysteine desulfurase family protein [Chloroflexota bacterium]|nr:cysteine desulfurase family protein [Chloroflexota bacterium]
MTQTTGDRINLDHAATTPLDPDVRRAMIEALGGSFGNPSSVHATGRRARAALDDARRGVARALGAQPHEVVFTSGGTEANNLAVAGVARHDSRGHVAVAAIEHHAVLRAAWALRDLGHAVSEIPVDGHGRVTPDALAGQLRPDTALVSIALANNEIGTVQDVPALVRIAHDAGALFHTDAVQAVGQLDINVDRLGVDLLSLSGHKIHGPKGIGALYVRDGVELEPMAWGGAQEMGRRAGTENVPGAVGMAHAVTAACATWRDLRVRLAALSGELIDAILAAAPHARLTGHPTSRLPSIASFAFADVDAESLLINLDLDGIDASSGAACEAGSIEPSHVVEALGLPPAYGRGSLRLSLGRDTTQAEILRAAEVVARHANRLHTAPAPAAAHAAGR